MTFVKISAEHSILRWLPLNFETDEGTGYLKNTIGDMFYSSDFKNVKIQFQPIQSVKKSQSKVSRIDYILYVSNSSEQL